ncbi:MAG: hypothetical protein WDZ46_10230 [Solirubrobacterales bacterium]
MEAEDVAVRAGVGEDAGVGDAEALEVVGKQGRIVIGVDLAVQARRFAPSRSSDALSLMYEHVFDLGETDFDGSSR